MNARSIKIQSSGNQYRPQILSPKSRAYNLGLGPNNLELTPHLTVQTQRTVVRGSGPESCRDSNSGAHL